MPLGRTDTRHDHRRDAGPVAFSASDCGRFRFARVPHPFATLVSYAVGALLGAAFLILPHAIELSFSVEQVGVTVLFGILLFFVLELLLWQHSHIDTA